MSDRIIRIKAYGPAELSLGSIPIPVVPKAVLTKREVPIREGFVKLDCLECRLFRARKNFVRRLFARDRSTRNVPASSA